MTKEEKEMRRTKAKGRRRETTRKKKGREEESVRGRKKRGIRRPDFCSKFDGDAPHPRHARETQSGRVPLHRYVRVSSLSAKLHCRKRPFPSLLV